uniref:Cystatin domain-containing protein n=1 Tax=Chelonoidis abingdonii TaxID=106734 RepID=A0A8C0J003_CHEAB
MWVGPSQGVGLPAYILSPHPQLWPFSAMAFPVAVAGPGLCFLLLLGVPLTLETSVAGGLDNVPVSDPEVQQAAQVAVKTYNDLNNCMYYTQGEKVLSAQRQVSGCRCYRGQGRGAGLCVLWVQLRMRGSGGAGIQGGRVAVRLQGVGGSDLVALGPRGRGAIVGTRSGGGQ